MMMKKFFTLLLILAVLSVMCLNGCVITENNSSGSSSDQSALSVSEQLNTTEYPIDILTIFSKAISDFTIIHADAPSETILFAVNDLCSYIEKAAGTRLAVSDDTISFDDEIVVGITDRDTDSVIAKRAELGEEGYIIYSEDGRLYITGNTERGTLYGVYSFLEDYLGCRFYTKDYEVIKENHKVDIPASIDHSFVPVFEFRDSFWYDTFDSLFSAKNKINNNNSGRLDNYGGGISYAGRSVHTLGDLAEMAGPTTGRQPCLSDESVYDTVIKNVRLWLEAHPKASIISVSQNDSMPDQLGCQCDDCKAFNARHGSEMATLLAFVNRVANDIKIDYPNVKVDTLAYFYTHALPNDIVPEDNVIIRICPIKSCYSHPFSECDSSEEFVSDLKAWSEVCETLYVWDYNTNFTVYNAPVPNLKVLWQNYQFMRDNNVVGIFEQGNYQSTNGEFCELRAYLVTKLLWDPDMTEEQYYNYMDDFLEGYYGAGWRSIREFIDTTSERAASIGHMYIYQSPKEYLKYNSGAKTEMEQMIALFDKAYTDAENEEYRSHVKKSSIQMHYAYLTALGYKGNESAFKELYDLMVKYGITKLSEQKDLTEANLRSMQ